MGFNGLPQLDKQRAQREQKRNEYNKVQAAAQADKTTSSHRRIWRNSHAYC
jgi:hypothetical protein